MQDRLVKLGYPAAFDNAGSLLLNEKGADSTASMKPLNCFGRERLWGIQTQ